MFIVDSGALHELRKLHLLAAGDDAVGLFGFGDQALCSCGDAVLDITGGHELERALTLNEIKSELWTWVS